VSCIGVTSGLGWEHSPPLFQSGDAAITLMGSEQAATSAPIVLVLAGELDVSDYADMTEQFDNAVRTAPAIVLDLSAVTFMDSTALGRLVYIYKQGAIFDVPLTLRAPSQRVRRLLELTGTWELFTIEAE
jgi:anti-sigma B factor antagonist